LSLRTCALWACLLLASFSLAQQGTYKIREGDTPERIAKKLGVTTGALLKANPNVRPTRMKPGTTLNIPGAGRGTTRTASRTRSSGGGNYVVRNGDNDWTLAQRFGITRRQLHAMNPRVDFSPLQVGVRLSVPAAKSTSSTARPAERTVAVRAGGTHRVRSGDNDWIVAKKYGITVAQLRALNPGVKWNRLQIDQTLRVPGASSPSRSATTVASISTKRAKLIRDDVAVRTGPSTNAKRVTRVAVGQVAGILDKENGWYKLRFDGGTVGWVRGDMLKPVKTSEVVASTPRSRSPRTVASSRPSRTSNPIVKGGSAVSTTALLDTAYGYQGTRYRWGGMSRSGFDCSGFVGYVYSQHGVRLPRTSIEMSGVGQAVDRDSLKQGDLLFFKTRRGTRVNHVGIYVGGGKFIHASSSAGRVLQDSLNGYYGRVLAGARRVTGKLAPSSRSKTRTTAQKLPAVTEDPTPEVTDEGSAAALPESERRRVTLGADEITK